ncbi:unannotated protein [freshwater metagenome]|uniref:Unannotated protein n=1 Tax=freshwater metagenome TaxID=449393 RepID=A0A6J7HHG4_9ZZZZ
MYRLASAATAARPTACRASTCRSAGRPGSFSPASRASDSIDRPRSLPPPPTATRSLSSVVSATRQPSPGSPSRSESGIRTSSKKTSLKSDCPPIWRSGRTVTPGACMSTTNIVSPPCLGRSGSVRVSRMPKSETCASVVQTFWPLTTQSSPSRTAVVRSAARSEPLAGSLNSWHQTSSARSSRARYFSCCSGVPCAMTVGPHMPIPMWLIRLGTRARASSWPTIACWASEPACPPCSAAQATPTSPASASTRWVRRSACSCSRGSAASSPASRCTSSAACSASRSRTRAR